ncbi:hypothetical protein GCM10010472_53670 [Pseudonocardia halophobica]|uniref:YncI copper-binding domain-containing protein n=1 Tax=Pseudonocardia halophobica TaxID=29401 RepID=A0A9W6UGF4_9PSEU|nr:DUF1775 domain-containing protein [Pseudonocardia halophobica]GLL16133.1 hypothetical protein GCM10017577_72880 [Pseudonocardia halophobica]
MRGFGGAAVPVRCALLMVLTLVGLGMVFAGAAVADVTLTPDHTEAGARDVAVTFRVTNDDPGDPVVALRVDLPTGRPLVDPQASSPAGWQVATTASGIEWTGGPVGSEPVDLVLRVGRMPDGAGPVRFRATQTSRSGAVVEWSDLVVPGRPAPAHTALELPYGAPRPAVPVGGHHDHDQAARDVAAGLPATPSPGATAAWTIGVGVALAVLVALGIRELGKWQAARFAAHRESGGGTAQERQAPDGPVSSGATHPAPSGAGGARDVTPRAERDRSR